jgi:hypothetical protein
MRLGGNRVIALLELKLDALVDHKIHYDQTIAELERMIEQASGLKSAGEESS